MQKNGIAEQDKANEGIVRFARELGPAAGRHRRRPLPAARGLRQPRGAALRADEVDAGGAEAELRHQRVLPQELRGDGRVVRRVAGGGADHAGDRRALQRRDRARQACCCRATRPPDGEEPEAMLRRIADEGLRARYGDPPPAEAVERLEFELGVIEEMGFSSYFLIVWDFVRYAKENGIAVGPGRGSAAGSIVSYVPQHHRPRPARQRPALRALPQPRPQIDAGHRHRLLGPRPRADDPLRRREVRPRVGRPDHHLRQDGAARRDPRRRPRARLRLRHRRPPREADPGADHGPQPVLRGMPEGGPGAETDLRRRARREADHRRRPGPRGDHPQQLDPRRRGGDRRPAAAGDRAAAAGRGPQRAGRRRTATATARPSASTRSSPSTRWGRSRRSAC